MKRVVLVIAGALILALAVWGGCTHLPKVILSFAWFGPFLKMAWPWVLGVVGLVVVGYVLYLARDVGTVIGLICAFLFVLAGLAMLGLPVAILWILPIPMIGKAWGTVVIIGLAAGYATQKKFPAPHPMFGQMAVGLIAVLVFLAVLAGAWKVVGFWNHETQNNKIVTDLVPIALKRIDARMGWHVSQYDAGPDRGIDVASAVTPPDNHPITAAPRSTPQESTFTEPFVPKCGAWRSKVKIRADDVVTITLDPSTTTLHLWGAGDSQIPISLVGFHDSTGAWVKPTSVKTLNEPRDFPDCSSPTGGLMARIGDGDDTQLFFIGQGRSIRVGGVGDRPLYFLLNEPQHQSWWDMLVPGEHVNLTITVKRKSGVWS